MSKKKIRIILKHKSSFKFKFLSTPMSNFPYYALIFLVPNTGGCCEVPVSVCAFSPQSHRNNTEISLILSRKNKGRSHHPHTWGAPEKLRNSRHIESVDRSSLKKPESTSQRKKKKLHDSKGKTRFLCHFPGTLNGCRFFAITVKASSLADLPIRTGGEARG